MKTRLRQLAKAVNRSHQAVHKWTRMHRWPLPKNRSGPWSAGEVAIIKAQSKTLAPNPAGDATGEDDPETMKAKTRLLQARAVKAEWQMAEYSETRVKHEEATAEFRRIQAIAKKHMDGLPAQMVADAIEHGLPAEAAEAMKAEVQKAVNGAMASMTWRGV